MSYHARALVGPRSRVGVVEVLWIEVEGRAVVLRISTLRSFELQNDLLTVQDFDPAEYQEK